MASCINKGFYCEHRDGILSFLKGTECKNCRGVEKTRYTWTGAAPKSVKSSAKSSDPDVVDLFPVVATSVGRVRARNFVNRFQRLLFSLLQLFRAFACDCMEKETPCYAQTITVPFGDYLVDSNLHTRLNGIFLDPQRGISNQIIKLTVTMYSAANFISNISVPVTGNLVQRRNDYGAESDEQQLQKRCYPIESYAIVYNFAGGSVVGQIIGNGFEYTTSAPTYSSAQICLPVDKSIPVNTNSYPTYGIGMVLGGVEKTYAEWFRTFLGWSTFQFVELKSLIKQL